MAEPIDVEVSFNKTAVDFEATSLGHLKDLIRDEWKIKSDFVLVYTTVNGDAKNIETQKNLDTLVKKLKKKDADIELKVQLLGDAGAEETKE